MPALISTMGPTSPLLDHNFNVHRSHDRNLKYPPGLGYGSSQSASASSPSLLLSPKGPTRRRSGSFTYTSGSSYATGNLFHGASDSLPSRLGKRSAMAAGFGQSGLQPRNYTGSFGSESSYELPPPSHSAKGSRFFELTPKSSNFDPFGSDDQLSLPPASSTSYSHFWEYDPSTKGPKLCSRPAVQSLLASPRPTTVKLPPVASLPFTDKPPVSSPPPTPRPFTRSLAPLSTPDKDARAKLLAGILLNRIYVVGKPMRRRFDQTLSREYVKSSLSSVVSFDC
jgi:hypothetical protein